MKSSLVAPNHDQSGIISMSSFSTRGADTSQTRPTGLNQSESRKHAPTPEFQSQGDRSLMYNFCLIMKKLFLYAKM